MPVSVEVPIEAPADHLPDPPTIPGSPAPIPLQPSAFDALGWTATGIQVPEPNPFLIVRVEGGLTVASNPEYTAYYCGFDCNLPLAGTTVGPQGAAATGGEFAVSVRIGGQGLSFTVDSTGLAMEARGIVFNAGQVEVSRRGGGPAGGCISDPQTLGCPPGVGGAESHQAAGYLINGAQTVSVRALNPLEVHADPTTVLIDAATGQADTDVTFTATSELSLNNTRWYFRAGDTLPEPLGRGGAGELGLPCALQTSCLYRPPASGRMYARSEVASSTVEAPSEVVWIRPDTMELTVAGTPDSVAQGDTVQFTSTDNFSGQDQVWSWQVEDTAAAPGQSGTVVACAGMSECGYAPPATGRMHLTAFNQAGDSAKAVSNLITVGPGQCPAPGGSADGKLVAAYDASCSALEVEVSVDVQAIHPRTAERTVSGEFRRGTSTGIAVTHRAQTPGRTTVTVRGSDSQGAVEGAAVSLRAVYQSRTGGHEHIAGDVELTSSSRKVTWPSHSLPDDGRPILGYFEDGQDWSPTIDGTTDLNGEVKATFVAGHMAGTMRFLVEAEAAGESDTASTAVQVAVPALQPPPFLSLAYYVGWGNQNHGVARNWFLRTDVAGHALSLAALLQRVDGSDLLYPQFNDASLEGGGSFNWRASGALEDHPYLDSHLSHRLGIDLDVAICRVKFTGWDEGETHRLHYGQCQGAQVIDILQAAEKADQVGAYVLREGDHLHFVFARPGLTNPGG
ncbi:MAG: hypothetical protein R3E10_03685 [Gemmatimonadota bacterium]